MPDIILSPDELIALTGYKRPADQLRRLHSRGFTRARIERGQVILTRAHFDAVEAGQIVKARPQLRLAA